MDLAVIERRLEAGEALKIKYRYPVEQVEGYHSRGYAVRSDKLVDVSAGLKRLYTKFRGETAIWLDLDEVVDILPDDGIYEDFPNG